MICVSPTHHPTDRPTIQLTNLPSNPLTYHPTDRPTIQLTNLPSNPLTYHPLTGLPSN
ncbi:hypothetical protein DPMN_183168 [Dreissena polymorpha]|uniref:Uncharacterized protein n=1 Tax=Dreissena polymorpha TaxID=45954 RepID=A0A9D4I648_DREPO|nr:hypothetical protein DPMN_183168 [Dreissena polymorpha]